MSHEQTAIDLFQSPRLFPLFFAPALKCSLLRPAASSLLPYSSYRHSLPCLQPLTSSRRRHFLSFPLIARKLFLPRLPRFCFKSLQPEAQAARPLRRHLLWRCTCQPRTAGCASRMSQRCLLRRVQHLSALTSTRAASRSPASPSGAGPPRESQRTANGFATTTAS